MYTGTGAEETYLFKLVTYMYENCYHCAVDHRRSGSLVLARVKALVRVRMCSSTMLEALNELHALCAAFVIFATLPC